MSLERSRANGRWGITQNSADPQSVVCGSALSLFIEYWSPTNQSSLGILKHNPLQLSCRPKALCHSLHTPVQRAFLPPRHAPRCYRKVDTIKAQLEWDACSDLIVVSHPNPKKATLSEEPAVGSSPEETDNETPSSEWHSLSRSENGNTEIAKHPERMAEHGTVHPLFGDNLWINIS